MRDIENSTYGNMVDYLRDEWDFDYDGSLDSNESITLLNKMEESIKIIKYLLRRDFTNEEIIEILNGSVELDSMAHDLNL